MIRTLATAKVGRLKIVIEIFYNTNGSVGMNNDKRLDQVTRKNYINFSEDF